jgi:hypothetical protein
VTPKVCAPWEIAPFDAFLFVMFALMAIAAMLLLIPYLRSIDERREMGQPSLIAARVSGRR